MKCDICGKRIQFGNSVSHSKKHVKRQWLPNIRKVTIAIDGNKMKAHICTRCLRNRYKTKTAG